MDNYDDANAIERAWRHGLKPDPLLMSRNGPTATGCFRRTRSMGTFQNRTPMENILFAVFLHEIRNQGLSTPFA